MSRFSLALLAIAGTLTAPSFASEADRSVVHEWNAQLEATIPASAGPTLPRYYSMMHIAMFDAVNSIEGGYSGYRHRLSVSQPASSDVAAAQAAHDVLVSLFPAATANADALLATRVQAADPALAQAGAQVGKTIAMKILHWRSTDGWSVPQTYTPAPVPGVWRPTPPAFAPAGFVQAVDAQPLSLPRPYYFMPRRPPELDSQEYADGVNEIQAIGGVNSTVRTAAQTQLARTWASVGYRQQWSAIWNNVTRDAARSQQLGLIETARVFALLNVSMQDGVQTAQASKYAYALWRPVHAIQLADQDMNAATTPDPTWMPLLPTPPYPSYAGNMACIGASAATSLRLFFGTNDMNVSATWTGLNGNADVTVAYPGFWQIAEAQAVSREYGGIHYHFDTLASQEMCPKVAGYVFANYMRPK
jgi:PAP2 superfamily